MPGKTTTTTQALCFPLTSFLIVQHPHPTTFDVLRLPHQLRITYSSHLHQPHIIPLPAPPSWITAQAISWTGKRTLPSTSFNQLRAHGERDPTIPTMIPISHTTPMMSTRVIKSPTHLAITSETQMVSPLYTLQMLMATPYLKRSSRNNHHDSLVPTSLGGSVRSFTAFFTLSAPA